MITLQELLIHFETSRKIGPASCQCKCPVHYDSKASLTISEDKGKLLLHCHAGYSKIRFEEKEIRYVTMDRKNDTYKYHKKSDHAVLCNLPSRIRAVKAGYPVYIAEGEKDADTLNKLGYTAATAGSTSDWRREYAFYFTGAKVVILPDKDEPGMKLKDQIVKDLRHFAHSIRWTITSMADKGDVTDYLTKEGHSKVELDELIVASENRGAPWLFTDGEGARAKVKINGDILADSISRGLPYLIVRTEYITNTAATR